MTSPNPIFDRTWRDRHNQALANPSTQEERHIQRLLEMLDDLASTPEYRDDPVVAKSVLKPLTDALAGYMDLDTGRLDPGTVLSMASSSLESLGVSLETL